MDLLRAKLRIPSRRMLPGVAIQLRRFEDCEEVFVNLKKQAAILLLMFIALFSASAKSQTSAQADPLYQTVLSLDTKLFNAYNTCDLATLGAMVSDDLEFYHDQTGLMVGKAPFLAAIKQNICGKVQRTLLKDTLEVYPLKNYGAVEIGIHRFRHVGQTVDAGDARFITLWQNKDGIWRVTRVISYEHNHGFLAK